MKDKIKLALASIILILVCFLPQSVANAAELDVPPPETAFNYNLESYFDLVGDASVDKTYPNVVKPVHPMALTQLGAMWSKKQIDLTKDFELSAYFYMYNPRGEVADGLTMTFHNDPRPTNQVIGLGGESLGAYGYVHEEMNNPQQNNYYIKNALSIEIDPYLNSDSIDRNVRGQHMAYLKPSHTLGMRGGAVTHTLYGNIAENLNLNVRAWRLLTVSWDSTQRKFRTKLQSIDSKGKPSQLLVDISSRDINTQEFFGGDMVHWGLTAATGGETGNIYLAMKQMPNVEFGELSKTVKNIVKDNSFKEETDGAPGDAVDYQLTFTNDEENGPHDMLISDTLEEGQTLVKNSTKYQLLDENDAVLEEGNIADSAWKKDKELEYISKVDFNTVTKMVVTYQVNLTNKSNATDWQVKNKFSVSSDTGMANTSNETTVNVNNEARFSHHVERTGDELQLYDSNFNGDFDKRFNSLIINVPKDVTIENLNNYLPTGWIDKGKSSTGDLNSYELDMNQGNTFANIVTLFDKLRFKVNSNVDKEGYIEAIFKTKNGSEKTYKAEIPQKIYVTGKDLSGKKVPAGNQVIDQKLRIGLEVPFTAKEVRGFEYVQLELPEGTELKPETFTVKKTKQDATARYKQSLVKLNIKQEIVKPFNNELVLPQTGYGSLAITDNGNQTSRHMSLPFVSVNESNQTFSQFKVALAEEQPMLSVSSIVPMYHELIGYTVSTEKTLHDVKNANKDFNTVDLNGVEELWVTIYIKPTKERPAFYSWDYGQNKQYQLIK